MRDFSKTRHLVHLLNFGIMTNLSFHERLTIILKDPIKVNYLYNERITEHEDKVRAMTAALKTDNIIFHQFDKKYA